MASEFEAFLISLFLIVPALLYAAMVINDMKKRDKIKLLARRAFVRFTRQMRSIERDGIKKLQLV